ncbi:UNVERIFIED_CONTAM: protein ARABIDILLO 1 [Sesamum radiatum]|uniref:Protein ARABIDILLO 1 n=1 Tax=Sesamum radiatum TaxID=300843 RepID=A0AAW2R0V1_SESRA
MSRRVRRRVVRRGQEKVDFPEIDENLTLDDKGVLDWTRLPDDTVLQLFSCLNYRDRASLSSTCRTWRTLGKSPCLWQMLDLRPHKLMLQLLHHLPLGVRIFRSFRFRGPESADAIIKLRAQNLREISADGCRKMTDATLSVLAARHEALECLQIGPFSAKGSKLRISGVHEVDADAINALAKHCQNLTDIGFIDCRKVDETAMSNVKSVRFLSVAGTTNIKWNLVVELWSKLPHLIGLDVSRTDISPNTVARFFSSSFSLKVLCALNCPALEEDATFVSNNNHKGKVLLAVFTDILKGVANLFVDTPKTERNIFQHWRNSKKDKKLDDILNWLESMICSSLLRFLRAIRLVWIISGSTKAQLCYLVLCRVHRKKFKKGQRQLLQLLL